MKKLILLLLVTLVLTGCVQKPHESELFAMNTYITQQVYGNNAEKAAKEVDAFIKKIETTLSLYVKDSDIDKVNNNAGSSPVKVNNVTFDLLKVAKKYGELSGGRFDITIAPLTKLWGITGDNPTVPSDTLIKQAVSLVDFEKIILDEKDKSIFLQDKGMAIDLGGIAKGYICNEISNIYKKNGVSGALASIGGNTLTYGTKPSDNQFTLGIRDPNGNANDLVGTLSVGDVVVATSGGYERYFEQDGKRYHHILDTKTGYPVDSDLLSVTVVSENGGLADFLSTTLFIAGSEHIQEYLNHEKFSVIVIDNKNNVYISDSLVKDFTLINKSYQQK